VSTKVHPRDLVLRQDGSEWLVEAKVVRSGNSTHAVRSALGQLYSYRHFLYGPESDVRLLGLFTEPIGAAYVTFLQECGIETVWREHGMWVGSATAEIDGVAQISE
jgi:hypothetical protein